MKILAIPTLFAFFIALLLLLEHVYGAENSSEEEEDEEDDNSTTEAEDEEKKLVAEKKKKEEELEKQKKQQALLQAVPAIPYQPYLEDPWYFYKWPGVGQSEGVVARWPWWPPQVPIASQALEIAQKDENKDKAQNDEDEEEDDEETDYYDDHHDDDHDHHHHHHFKQKPTAVSSVGFGPAVGKATWYGVLNAKVNSRSDLWSYEDEEEPVQPQRRRFSPRVQYYDKPAYSSEEYDDYPQVWARSYGPPPDQEEIIVINNNEWK